MARRKVKNGEKSSWGQCLTRPVPNGCRRSAFWLGRKTQKFSGTNQKAERQRPFGTGLVTLFQGCCSFVLRHLCPVHKINAQTPITTDLLHEFLVNVKQRMDWSYICCLSLNFWKQYPADGICLTSVNMQKYVTSLWLRWKIPIFPDLYRNTWLGKLSVTGKRIIKFSWHCNRCHTLILWGDPKYRCSFRINRI